MRFSLFVLSFVRTGGLISMGTSGCHQGFKKEQESMPVPGTVPRQEVSGVESRRDIHVSFGSLGTSGQHAAHDRHSNRS